MRRVPSPKDKASSQQIHHEVAYSKWYAIFGSFITGQKALRILEMWILSFISYRYSWLRLEFSRVLPGLPDEKISFWTQEFAMLLNVRLLNHKDRC